MGLACRIFKQRLKATGLLDPINFVKYLKCIRSHKIAGDQWDKIISDYINGKIKRHQFLPKQNIGTEKIIWQYWGQGLEKKNLPESTQISFDSVDKFADDFKVIRLSDHNLSDYIDIPTELLHKRDSGQMNRAFFSDVLRVMLLATYGGIWLDATIFMTGKFPEEYMQGDHFCFQRDDNEPYKKVWENDFIYYYCWRDRFEVRMLNSIMWAKKGSEMMSILSDLLLYYWQHHDKSNEYFFFQVLYNRLTTGAYKHLKPKVVSDCTPHILYAVLIGTILPYTIDDALAKSNLHKLSYFKKGNLERLKKVAREVDVNR